MSASGRLRSSAPAFQEPPANARPGPDGDQFGDLIDLAVGDAHRPPPRRAPAAPRRHGTEGADLQRHVLCRTEVIAYPSTSAPAHENRKSMSI